jgi:hypothetical protein
MQFPATFDSQGGAHGAATGVTGVHPQPHPLLVLVVVLFEQAIIYLFNYYYA